jgi:thioesterase domain-containing protein/acyl carrier protein
MDDLTGIESAIKAVWQEVLDRKGLSSSDNFFEVGGDASGAQRVCAEIKRRFGCTITPDEFLAMPTMGALAVMVRTNSTGSVAESLFCMQEGAPGRRVIYCIPPIGGTPARFSGLFEYLPLEQPVYGLQSVGLLAGRRPDRTVAAMARRHSQDILSHGGTGEAVLLGYSFGGLLVVETARELIAAGCTRPIMAVIDCPPTESSDEDAKEFSYRGIIEMMLQLPVNAKTYASSLMILSQDDALRNIRDFAVRTGALPKNFDLDRLRRLAEVCEMNLRAGESYQPSWLGGDLTVFESPAGTQIRVGEQWYPYFDHVDIQRLDGDHRSILEGEDLAPIAAWLIDQAAPHPVRPQGGPAAGGDSKARP